jgi:hypothetical protein
MVEGDFIITFAEATHPNRVLRQGIPALTTFLENKGFFNIRPDDKEKEQIHLTGRSARFGELQRDEATLARKVDSHLLSLYCSVSQ